MADEKTWTVVKFVEENTVEAVPSNWVHNGRCYWPDYSQSRLKQSLMKREPPDSTSWLDYEIYQFRNSVFDDYSIALQKANKATNSSDLDSDHTQSRKRKFKKIFSFTSVESDSEQETFHSALPPVPELQRSETSVVSKKKKASSSNQSQVTIEERSVEHNLPGNISQEQIVGRSTSSKKNIPNDYADLVVENIAQEQLDQFLPTVDRNSSLSVMEGNTRSVNNKSTSLDTNANESRQIENSCTERAMLIKIIKKQNIQNALLMDINTRLQKLEEKMYSGILAPSTAEIIENDSIFTKFDFPFNDLQNLSEFEIVITNDGELFNKTVQELSRMGGSEEYNFVVRTLSKIITNMLASEFSYLGKRKKKPFIKLSLNKLIIDAGMLLFKNSSRDIFEKSISKWLKRAKERKA